jgi:UDP-2-acetamido-2-deoxy-ribo-hexuluronate aminotransferase
MSIWRKNLLATSNKNLILDVSTIINLWLGGERADQTEKLINEASAQGARLWVVAASLATLEYVARNRLKKSGIEPEAVTQIVRRLMDDLFSSTGVLTNYGFEQVELYKAARDYEDAQITAAARSLSGVRICIVTEDENFDTLGEIPIKNPLQTLAWLRGEGDAGVTNQPIPFIDLKTQQAAIRPQLERNIETVLRHGQYIMGPEIKQLEERLAEYVGVEHCIAVSDGTKALLIAMMALGIKAGDEVITTPFTFIATGEMIALLGAIPVFVDIDPRTYNIDSNKIEAVITPKTKAIMPVSLYGQCADFDAINAIAAKHGLPVIEDGAQSFGATYKGRKTCGLSIIGSASFFPSKPLGCYGDGGALFTNDDALAKTMREIRVHGQDRRYHHPIIGINGRMDTLQAAIILAKLDIFDDEVKARAEIGARYTELLNSPLPAAGELGEREKLPLSTGEGWGGGNTDSTNAKIVTPYIEPHNTSVYAQYTVLVENREAVQKKLNEAGIPTAVHYPIPLNLQPAFVHLNKPAGSFSVAEAMAKRVLSLPMGPNISPVTQETIVRQLCIGHS